MNGGMFGGNNNNTGAVVVMENGIQFSDLSIQNTAYVVSNSAIRNRIINGAMKIDQRNAGVAQAIVAAAALAYTVDRYYSFCTGANITGQRITLANAQNRYRLTGLAAVTGVGFGQRIESFNCMDLAGINASLQVKLSSSSLTAITWTAYYATAADTFGTLAAPTRTQIATGQFTINTVEATYSAQMAIPAAATTGIEIVFTGGALLGAQTLTIGDVQFEAGNISTPFENNNIEVITAKCQRYFFRTLDSYIISGNSDLAGRQLVSNYSFPVTLRAVPAGLTGGFSVFTNCTQNSFSATVSSTVAILASVAAGGFSATLTWGAFSAEL